MDKNKIISEDKVKKELKKVLNKYVELGDMYYFMPVQSTYSKRGVPDFIICYLGCFFGIETKSSDKEHNTTELQKKNIDQILKAGGTAGVICNLEQIKEFEEQLIKYESVFRNVNKESIEENLDNITEFDVNIESVEKKLDDVVEFNFNPDDYKIE